MSAAKVNKRKQTPAGYISADVLQNSDGQPFLISGYAGGKDGGEDGIGYAIPSTVTLLDLGSDVTHWAQHARDLLWDIKLGVEHRGEMANIQAALAFIGMIYDVGNAIGYIGAEQERVDREAGA